MLPFLSLTMRHLITISSCNKISAILRRVFNYSSLYKAWLLKEERKFEIELKFAFFNLKKWKMVIMHFDAIYDWILQL